jgi:hypothetical protein
LVVLLIIFALGFKILLLPFFSYMLDSLATVIPGAMCGAGVMAAGDFGPQLLTLKVLILALAGVWLVVNHQDLRAVNYPHFKAKLRLFLVIFVLIAAETTLDFIYLSSISTLSPVSCCSVIYGVAGEGSTLPFGLEVGSLLLLFALVYILVVVLALARYPLLGLPANIALLYLGYQSVVHFFGTYIYQLPTHKCPFCMLQGEYLYVGYLIWAALFMGVFFGVAGYLLKLILGRDLPFTYRYCIIFNTLFVVICGLYVGVYYLRNGVLL